MRLTKARTNVQYKEKFQKLYALNNFQTELFFYNILILHWMVGAYVFMNIGVKKIPVY